MANHYYIQLKQPLPTAQWLRQLSRLKANAKRQGLNLSEFDTETPFDQAAIEKTDSRDFFEGFIHNSKSDWKKALEQVLVDSGIKFVDIRE